MKKIETNIDIGGIICQEDVLGSNIEINIASQKGCFCVPCGDPLPEESVNVVPLKPPRDADTRLDLSPTEWGELGNIGGNKRAFVKAFRIYFELKETKKDNKTLADELGQQINEEASKWISILKDNLEILSLQDLSKVLRRKVTDTSILKFRTWNDKNEEDGSYRSISVGDKHSIIIQDRHDIQVPLNLSMLKKALNNADNCIKPKLEHLLLRDSRNAFFREDFRSCVLECATALEVGLTLKIKEMLESQGKESQTNELLDKFRTLGNRVWLCNFLEISLGHTTDTIQNKVVNLRNKTIHKGYFPGISETFETLKMVSEIVDKVELEMFDAV